MSHRKVHGFHEKKNKVNGAKSSWMLFNVGGEIDPVSAFNKSLDEFAGAKIFDSRDELDSWFNMHASFGTPYIVEVEMEKANLLKFIKRGGYKEIAESVITMNDQKVKFEKGKFSYSDPEVAAIFNKF